MGVLAKFEAWAVKPVTEDLSPVTLIALTALLVVTVFWTIDGISIIRKGLQQ